MSGTQVAPEKPEIELVADYNEREIQLAITQIARCVVLSSDCLLKGLKDGNGCVTDLGGVLTLLEMNQQRVKHIIQRIAGKTTKPFAFVPHPIEVQTSKKTML